MFPRCMIKEAKHGLLVSCDPCQFTYFENIDYLLEKQYTHSLQMFQIHWKIKAVSSVHSQANILSN